jgi:TonB-linked SusC/RagA family outer membrane protein
MKKFLLLCFSFGFALSVWAQDRVVTGRVTSKEDGSPLPGVNVVVKGTTNGSVTDADGKFSLTVAGNGSLVFSFIGLKTEEIEIGDRSVVDIQLGLDITQLSEVVVTGLGIQKEKKALGYAVSTVSSDLINQRAEGDVMRVLSGKAAGVDITQTSGLAGSGTNINIRGFSSITGSTQPLFVVDGVAWDGGTNSQANFVYGSQTGSRFFDIDPNSIESVSILKGLNATVLYGEAGRNGVILITTKNGASATKKKAPVSVSFNSSYSAVKVAQFPEYQDHWGGGFNQIGGSAYFSNWGSPLDGHLIAHPYDKPSFNVAFPQYVGATYAYKPYNSVPRFFKTGYTLSNSFNISGGTDKARLNANVGFQNTDGFSPYSTNTTSRVNFGLGGSFDISEKFKFTGTFNFVRSNVITPPTAVSFGSSASSGISLFGDVWYTPRSIDLMGLPWENPLDHSSAYYRPSNDIPNPIWTAHNASNGQKTNRVYGQMALTYSPLKNLSFTYRAGYDVYSEEGSFYLNKGNGGSNYNTGFYRNTVALSAIFDQYLIGNYSGKLSDNIGVTVDAGMNYRSKEYNQSGMLSQQQLVYGLVDHSNFVTHQNTDEAGFDLDYKTKIYSLGVFAQTAFDYKNFVFLNLGGRYGSSSTVEAGNRSIFFPSVSTSIVLSDAFPSLQSNVVNYLKLRAGYATSANFPGAYATRQSLGSSTNSFVGPTGVILNLNYTNGTLANPNLKPELLGELEAGIEGKFWNNRITFDFTVFDKRSTKQILQRPLDPSTGYTTILTNAGSMYNKGVELNMGVDVIKNTNWTWNVTGIWSLYRNKVYDMPSYAKQIALTGFSNLGNYAIEGQPINVIQGIARTRDAKGNFLVDQNTGIWDKNSQISIIGNPNPNYKLTGITTLSYKAFSFRMQWNYVSGGSLYSTTSNILLSRGLTKDTDFDRTLPIALKGVSDVDGTPNRALVSASDAYFTGLLNNSDDTKVYDASVIRLKEISLSYQIPQSVLAKTKIIKTAAVSVTGANLWYRGLGLPKYTHVDPEQNSLGVGNGRGFEYMTSPSSKTYGVNLNLTF